MNKVFPVFLAVLSWTTTPYFRRISSIIAREGFRVVAGRIRVLGTAHLIQLRNVRTLTLFPLGALGHDHAVTTLQSRHVAAIA